MTYTVKMCTINGGPLRMCLDCRYLLDTIGCHRFLYAGGGRIVYRNVDDNECLWNVNRYLGKIKW